MEMKMIQWYVQFKMWTHFLNGIYSTIFFLSTFEFSILNAIANINVISYSKIIEKWLRIFFNRKLSSLSLSLSAERANIDMQSTPPMHYAITHLSQQWKKMPLSCERFFSHTNAIRIFYKLNHRTKCFPIDI